MTDIEYVKVDKDDLNDILMILERYDQILDIVEGDKKIVNDLTKKLRDYKNE